MEARGTLWPRFICDNRATGGRHMTRRESSVTTDLRDLLDVDGPRPAVAWVSLLPDAWLIPGDRALLYVLALDSFDQRPPFTSRPSRADLLRWVGDKSHATLADRIERLSRPVEGVRSALLEVTRGTGRRRSEYRLCTEHGPPLWSGGSEHNEPGSAPVDRNTTRVPVDRNTNTPSVPVCVPGCVPVDRNTPYPYPSSIPYQPNVTEHAREADGVAAAETTETLDRIRRRTGVLVDADLVAAHLGAGWTMPDIVGAVTAETLNGARNPRAVLEKRLRNLGPAPYRRPAWCGTCDERTRLVETDDDRATPCPRCHPTSTGERTR